MPVRFVLLVLAIMAGCMAPGAAALRAAPGLTGWPLVDNVSARDARLAGPVWAVVATRSSEIIVGANKLMLFDGAEWREIGVPGGYAFRALAAGTDGRIWIGGTGALGFLAKDRAGRWQFTSLLEEARAAGFGLPEEIWHVAPTATGAVFVAPQRVLRWNGDRFELWSLPCAPRLFSHAVGNQLVLHQPGVGLLRVENDGPVLLRPTALLPEGLILWTIAPTQTVAEDSSCIGWIVGTNDGAFRLTGTGIQPLPELSRILAGQLPTCAVPVGHDLFAVGTYQRGIVLAARADGSVRGVYDRRAGLADDRVNTLFVDGGGRLWAGLSLGLARIEPTRHVSYFDRRNGLQDGPLTRVFAQRGDLFASTSKTIYRIVPGIAPDAAARLEPLSPLNTFIWDTTTVGDEIFAAGFGGLWRLARPEGFPVPPWKHEHHVSADVFRVVTSQYLADTLFFFEGHQLKALQRAGRDWVPRTLVRDLGDTPVSLIEDAGGDVWASLMVRGIRRFRVIDDVDGLPMSLRLTQSFEPGRGLPPDTVRPRLSLLGANVIAFTESAVLLRPDEGDMFSPVSTLAGWVGIAAAPADANSAWWIVQGRDVGRFGIPALLQVRSAESEEATAISWEPRNAPGLDTLRLITSLEAQSDGSRTMLWVGGADGLLRVEPTPAGPPPEAFLQSVRVEGTMAPLPADGTKLTVPPGATGLVFRLFAPAAIRGEPVFFQTRLEGAESAWSPLQREPERALTGLAPGPYVFQARAVDRWGRAGPAVSYPFVVLTPWYRTAPAIAAYVAAGLLLVGVIVGLRIRYLHRRTAELNRLVDKRTRELAVANAAKGEFLENISHEIRNPVNGILGLVGMIREGSSDPRERELARSLTTCARSLTRIVDEVLNFSKLEHGQVPLRERGFVLSEIVEEVVTLFRTSANERGCTLSVRREGDALNHFHGDAEKIASILGNFVSNALKYAPGSPVEILIQCEGVDPFGADITLNVSDLGPGIPPAEQEVIFQKFVRGSQAQQRRAPGAGLGLATCRALAELLGGHVGVETPSLLADANGQSAGTTFFLTLRLKRDHQRTAAAAGIPTASAPSSGERALIVEDQAYNQIVVRRIAEQLGFACEVAQDANDALRQLARERYAAVFLDWELPDLRGDEVARRIRSLPSGQDVIVIATTAHDDPQIREQCQAAGMDGYALKPFDIATMARLLDDARAQRGRISGPAAAQLDLRVFRFVSNDDPQQTGQSLQLYLDILDRELASLDQSVRAADAAGASRIAHRLKAHAGLVNAAELRDAAHRLQDAAAHAEPAQLVELQRELVRHATVLRENLRAWRDQNAISAG